MTKKPVVTALRITATVRRILFTGPDIQTQKLLYPSAMTPFTPAFSAAFFGATDDDRASIKLCSIAIYYI